MTNRDRIAEYFARMYDTKTGTTEENVEGLFHEDLVFHLTNDKSMGRRELIMLSNLLRRTRHNSTVSVEDFEADGDTVSFRLHIHAEDPVTGHTVTVGTRTYYRFGDDDLVVEAWQDDPSQTEQAVRAMGVRP